MYNENVIELLNKLKSDPDRLTRQYTYELIEILKSYGVSINETRLPESGVIINGGVIINKESVLNRPNFGTQNNVIDSLVQRSNVGNQGNSTSPDEDKE